MSRLKGIIGKEMRNITNRNMANEWEYPYWLFDIKTKEVLKKTSMTFKEAMKKNKVLEQNDMPWIFQKMGV